MIELEFLGVLCCSLLAAGILSLRQAARQEWERAIQDDPGLGFRMLGDALVRFQLQHEEMERAFARALAATKRFNRAATAARESLARRS